MAEQGVEGGGGGSFDLEEPFLHRMEITEHSAVPPIEQNGNVFVEPQSFLPVTEVGKAIVVIPHKVDKSLKLRLAANAPGATNGLKKSTELLTMDLA